MNKDRKSFLAALFVIMLFALAAGFGIVGGYLLDSLVFAEEPRVEQAADGEEPTLVDCGAGIYRLDVKNGADSQKVYEAALVKLSKDHADELVVPMMTPVNSKGNTGLTSYYWRVCKK